MNKFLRHLIAMATPAPVPIIEALSADEIETTEATNATDAAEEGRKEKERLRAILNCQESVGREKLAQYLAVSTELTPSEAQAVLSASPHAVTPKESGKATANNFFEQHRAENPELWNPQPPLSVAETIDRMNRNYAAATGVEVARK
jgi:hypothetical protein